MNRLIFQDKTFTQYEYSSEEEFEKTVIKYSQSIFGNNSLYIDVKKRIGDDNILTIPDGYLIDFSFKTDPRLYIIENELVVHDPYKHIGQQLLRFAISYKASGRKIKNFLLEKVLDNKSYTSLINKAFSNANYRNIDNFFESIIFDKSIAAIVIIDEVTSDLENVLSQLTMKTDVIEFQTFINGDEKIHKFTPFQQEFRNITESREPKIAIEELDTIVVPANEDGFNEVFLGEECWWAIRISSSMINRIKFIAGYQTSPISAITYFAEVSRIEKYKDTNKYIVYFKQKAKKIGPIGLPKNVKGIAPQGPKYTSFEKLKTAKTLSDIF